MTTTIQVRLGEVPTDVLVWLVDNGRATARVLARVAPEDAESPWTQISRALYLLVELDFVTMHRPFLDPESIEWEATDSGIAIVHEARERASENDPSLN